MSAQSYAALQRIIDIFSGSSLPARRLQNGLIGALQTAIKKNPRNRQAIISTFREDLRKIAQTTELKEMLLPVLKASNQLYLPALN